MHGTVTRQPCRQRTVGQFTTSLRGAIGALLVPVVLAIYEIATTGDVRAWVRLVALLTAIGGVAIALRAWQ